MAIAIVRWTEQSAARKSQFQDVTGWARLKLLENWASCFSEELKSEGM